jgi:hypothetical protein
MHKNNQKPGGIYEMVPTTGLVPAIFGYHLLFIHASGEITTLKPL